MVKLMNMKFSIEEISLAIGMRRCLICKEDLEEKYHLPICKKHRLQSLEELNATAIKPKTN